MPARGEWRECLTTNCHHSAELSRNGLTSDTVVSYSLCIHFSIGGWKDTSIAPVIIIIISEVSTFPIVFIFSVVVCLSCLLHHILSLIVYTFRQNRHLFSLVLCSLWWVQIVGCVLACRSYSFVCTLHHLIIIIVQILSEDIELIKCLSDMVCRVCE